MTVPLRLPPMDDVALADDRLLLRPMRASDAEALWHAGQAEDVGHYTSIEWPFTRDAARRLIADAAREWAAGSAARFAIVERREGDDALFAGTASLLHIYPERLDAEIGYWLGQAGRGRGLTRRAVALLSEWAFGEVGLRRLHLMVDLDNQASHAVARANGFVPVGEELWRHPSDRSKDGIVLVYERLALGTPTP